MIVVVTRRTAQRFLAVVSLALPEGLSAQSDSAFQIPLEVKVDGVITRATLFVASGAEPRATLITFRGFPGGASNDLSAFMQSKGINSVIMNFRGQNESDGTYDVAGTAADAAAIFNFLKSDSVQERFRIAPRRIAISGQSAGSFATLSLASSEPSIRCVALTVPFNWALPLYDMRSNPVVRTAGTSRINSIANQTPPLVRLDSAFVSRTMGHAESLDLRTVATQVKGRNILMIGAARDGTAPMPVHFVPVRDSLRLARSTVRDTTFDDVHDLSSSVPAYFAMLANWVGTCAR